MSEDFDAIAILPRTLGLPGEIEAAKRELLIMRVGARLIGIFADEAWYIVRHKKLTPLPRAPRAVCGVVAIRGQMYTVIAPYELLDLQGESDRRGFIVALRGDEQIALSVDAVEGVIEVRESELQVLATGPKLMRGAVEYGDQLIAILDTSRIFEAAIG